MTIKPWIAAVLMGLVLPAVAEPFEQAANALCEKSKMCAKASMVGEEIRPEMMAMINQQLEGMCGSMLASFQASGMESHALYKPAVACMKSMAVLSCEELEADTSTPACDAYHKKLDSYGE